jgi:hypothetical protein
MISQSCDGWHLEDSARRQLNLKHAAQPVRELHGQQGLASNLEEVVVHIHPFGGQQFRPNLRDLPFCFCAWRSEFTSQTARGLRRGQGVAIDLAVPCARQRLERHHDRRQEIMRQFRLQVALHFCDGEDNLRTWCHIGNQPFLLSLVS